MSSKIFSYAENEIFDEENFASEVVEQAETLIKGEKVDLARKFGWWVANAGIDRSNAPSGKAIRWVKNPQKSCNDLRDKLMSHFGLDRLGVIMVDSFCTPGRVGVIGGAVAVSGFEPVIDKRGTTDIFGNELKITQIAVGDMLASSANIVMGEGDEKIPICIIRSFEAVFCNKVDSIKKMQINPKECLFNPIYHA